MLFECLCDLLLEGCGVELVCVISSCSVFVVFGGELLLDWFSV